MPSPTSRTRPTSRASSVGLISLISRSSTEVISLALNLIATTLDELIADQVKTGTHTRIEDTVADAQYQAAQQVGIDPGAQHRLALERLPQLLPQPLLLLVGQAHGRFHLDRNASRTAVVEIAIRLGNGPQHVQAIVVVEHIQEVDEQLVGPALEG